MDRLRLGELLVQAKLLTQERLDDVLVLQRSQGRKLGQLLVELGIVNETQLTQTLGLQLSVPWVSLHHIDFSRQLLNLVPREVAERFCLVPIYVRRVRKQGETLYVAMDDPTHEAALEAVRVASSLPVRPMIAAGSEIRSALRVYYGDGEPAPAPPKAVVEPPDEPSSGPLTVKSVAPGPVSSPEGAPLESPPASRSPASEPPPSGDSPDAAPEVEVRTLELPERKGGPKMVGVTLLDGTTIRLPARPRRRHEPAEEGLPPSSGSGALASMTARDLIKALGAVAEGADAREVFGDRVPIEAICAALLSLLLRKGVIADWEFVEELKRK